VRRSCCCSSVKVKSIGQSEAEFIPHPAPPVVAARNALSARQGSVPRRHFGALLRLSSRLSRAPPSGAREAKPRDLLLALFRCAFFAVSAVFPLPFSALKTATGEKTSAKNAETAETVDSARSGRVRVRVGRKDFMRPVCIQTHGSAMSETVANLLRRCADPDCGEEFEPRKPWQRYHSPACRRRHSWLREKEKAGPSTPPPVVEQRAEFARDDKQEKRRRNNLRHQLAVHLTLTILRTDTTDEPIDQ